MDLNYYLDLKRLSDVDKNKIDSLFSFAYKIWMTSIKNANINITESFFRDGDTAFISYGHISNVPLHDIIFSGNGEVANKIIPAIWRLFKSCGNPDQIKYGVISGETMGIYPNAKFVTSKVHDEIWHLTETSDYHNFRSYNIIQALFSNNCEKYLEIYLPNLEFTKKALNDYKNLEKNIKHQIISNLKKLDDFVGNEWKQGDFPIDLFSKESGVNASDESDSTKNNPKLKNLRKFSIPKLGSVYCFLHIKISSHRIHFYPDKVGKKVHIAYIGKHLKTAKF